MPACGDDAARILPCRPYNRQLWQAPIGIQQTIFAIFQTFGDLNFSATPKGQALRRIHQAPRVGLRQRRLRFLCRGRAYQKLHLAICLTIIAGDPMRDQINCRAACLTHVPGARTDCGLPYNVHGGGRITKMMLVCSTSKPQARTAFLGLKVILLKMYATYSRSPLLVNSMLGSCISRA